MIPAKEKNSMDNGGRMVVSGILLRPYIIMA